MPKQSFPSGKIDLSRLGDVLDSVLSMVSIYIVPIAIALMSLMALLVWDNHYQTDGGETLTLRVIAQNTENISPSDARILLASRPATSKFDTKLSEAPVWFSFSADKSLAGAQMVEFPSRHMVDIACWDNASLRSLGRASRLTAEGLLTEVKAGFAIRVERPDSNVLCRANFVGPARLTALSWPASQLDISVQEFHRKSGLLDGGLTVLAIFVLTTALINRQKLYLLFSAWLFLNLRIGALSAGWDIQWLGQDVPPEFLLASRTVTIALYGLVTVTLYKTLFRDALAGSRYQRLVDIVQWACVPLLACSVLMSFRSFLPVMWVFTGAGLLLVTFSLVHILRRSHTAVAIWYGASFGVTFVSSLFEVIAAALGMRELVGVANSVTAALASSLLAALAIAEQMRIEHRQRLEVQAELEHTYEAMPIGLFTLDMSGQFVSANPALTAMLAENVLAPAHNAWTRYFSEDSWSELVRTVHSGRDGELELEGIGHPASGEPKRYLVKATLARGKIEGSLQDVTEKSRATEDLRFMANNDPLTKVFNRRGIEKEFNQAREGALHGKPLALAYLDLDRFKLINDLFGHAAGDEVLRQVCDRVGVVLASAHRIGRIGGDEFLIIMPDTNITLASLICRSIVERMGSMPFRVGDKAFHVRGSIGLIEVSPDSKMKDSISAADRACREAKAGHSDGVVVYERDAAAFLEREAELDLLGRLSSNAMSDGLFLEMQPIMSLKKPHESLNFEVLLRMRDRDGSTIPASRIIVAAESSGQIGAIDRWVLSTTLAWVEVNYARLARTQFVCMNLSGASLNDERFVQDTITLLAQSSHAASKLCIEITEGVALHDLNNTRRFIDKVRSYGARIGLDDFGAGYTSFSYLKELPADVLKIDGSFIVNMNDHPANVAIVEAIVTLATNLGMKTIAEWAEDFATVQTLAELGVDYVQGYAVARPLSPARLLTATSAASFIEDPDLARYARALGSMPATSTESDLLDISNFRDLH